jgi:N-glycosylase/DNA lyase
MQIFAHEICMQSGVIFIKDEMVTIELPAAHELVMPNVPWGSIEIIGTPAHWAYLVNCRKHEQRPIKSKLGNSLIEETAACLLGGHGIPAQVGLVAYETLKAKGAFNGEHINEDVLLDWLSQPLLINDKLVKYRFARQKSRYLANAIDFIRKHDMPLHSGKALRDLLLEIPGIGLKTASWIARNWLNSNDVAILDIHILRAGIIGKFMDSKLRVEKNYLELEKQFLNFTNAINIPASELDAEIWWQFSQAPKLIHVMFGSTEFMPGRVKSLKKSGSKKSQTNSSQATLFV